MVFQVDDLVGRGKLQVKAVFLKSEMRVFRWALVRVLLFKTFARMLARQFFLKLTKFTRRSREAKDLVSKGGKAYEFLRDMCRHNQRAIQRSKLCLESLAARGVREVSVYGARDMTEILYDLTFEIPIKIRAVYDGGGRKSFLGIDVLPLEESTRSQEKVIIASLVAVESKVERLQNLGIDRKRIVLLADGSSI